MTITIQLASVPDREKAVAELWVGDTQIAEVSNENDEMRVEFYSAPVPHQLVLSLEELTQALEKAKNSLAT